MRIYNEQQLKEIEEKGVECPECGKKSMDYQNGYPVRKDYCFSCNFWTDRVWDMQLNDGNLRFIIDKHMYSTPKMVENRVGGKYAGFGGRKFLIKINDTQEVIETHNLWHQGDVPIHFLDRLPDTATFVDQKAWIKIGDVEYLGDVEK